MKQGRQIGQIKFIIHEMILNEQEQQENYVPLQISASPAPKTIPNIGIFYIVQTLIRHLGKEIGLDLTMETINKAIYGGITTKQTSEHLSPAAEAAIQTLHGREVPEGLDLGDVIDTLTIEYRTVTKDGEEQPGGCVVSDNIEMLNPSKVFAASDYVIAYMIRKSRKPKIVLEYLIQSIKDACETEGLELDDEGDSEG